ncbi:hypothetical protein B0I35DRAFT_473739 [Stachybotrys elegans]|uniref:Kelch repeat protein n=1 Tax=Stachybotrys elegans TaxID=80388 RepID=A0A8K0T2Q4_9HYPO|nr:hypothetical protein B0I35DRAFT_473739 [Stachybotrys elegans]
MRSPFNCQKAFGLTALVVLTFASRSLQQRDPIRDFCRRWGHQTAVVDDRLYVDGGMMNWNPMSQFPENYTNTFLIYHDLSTVSSSGMPPPHANLSKNSSVPSVQGGVLWPDEVNKRIYMYGGEFRGERPWRFSLYSYDIINDFWEDSYASSQTHDIRRRSYGAGVSISSRGEGYYYGGWINNASDANWDSQTGQATSYLLRYNMDSNEWTNQTGPDEVGRAEGAMVHIPIGDGGFLVYFGGIRGQENGTWEAQPMDEILLFDVVSGKSYIQRATGRVPQARRRFCAGAAWAQDQSSYNIYLYGGGGQAQGSAGFDDIYVLSIPSFTWVRMWPETGNQTGEWPHHSLSCNIVREAQMIVHGGSFPLHSDCDSATQWGLHNMDLGQQNQDNAVWALYDPSKSRYVVPDAVREVVGGDGEGGATMTAPAEGFMHPDLDVLMTRQASVATRAPTRAVSPTGTSTSSPESDEALTAGGIAGIVIGGVAALFICFLACFCIIRRRRRIRSQTSSQQPMAQMHPWIAQLPTHSSFSPSPSTTRPQTMPPYSGPPVELPSGEENELSIGSPYSEVSLTEPKNDPHGLWRHQAMLMQGPGSPPLQPPHSMGLNAAPPLQTSSRYNHGYAPRDLREN